MPRIYILCGPNGSGKSTAARALLRQFLHCTEFVNADEIARGLSAFRPESVAFQAGRMMVARVKELARQRVDFAFETTLASRAFASWLRQVQTEGYQIHLYYFFLPQVEMALKRVEFRVRAGGHHVPEDDIRRRFERSRSNFMKLYMPLANLWEFYDTSLIKPKLVAFGGRNKQITVVESSIWDKLNVGL
jgi:predicted ABC-type ATPase